MPATATLIQLQFKCSTCGSRNVDGVVTGTCYGMDAASRTLRPPLRRERVITTYDGLEHRENAGGM
jgi:hypothetical protein